MTGKNKRPTPSSHQFKKHLDEVVKPALLAKYGKHAWRILGFLQHLEQLRYDYSADRAFQTRPISNAALAAYMDVTERTIRRWMAALESMGFIKRELRKNRHHKYKNLLNRIQFVGFCGWFKELVSKLPDTTCPPNKKDIKDISINNQNIDDEKKRRPAFPSSGSIRYDNYWKDLALRHLPSGSRRPCIDMVAKRFRENLKGHAVALNHQSITKRWIGFCQRAKPV